MKFLIDAQLPKRLCDWLRAKGYDALHTLDLNLGIWKILIYLL